jgi:Fe2+ or Zn2+ uptake regulation protein
MDRKSIILEKLRSSGLRLTRQRIKIAQNGQKKYNKYFNSVNVAEFIINKTLDYKNKKKFIWSE